MRTKTLAMLLVTLAVATLTVFGQEGAISSQRELKKALASARTPADHARIAYYYHQAAHTYVQKQSEEEQIAAQWKKQYESWEKSPNPYQSAKSLATYYAKLARDASNRAEEQDKLAGNQPVVSKL